MPIIKNEYLTSPISKEKIMGYGGMFNPIKDLKVLKDYLNQK